MKQNLIKLSTLCVLSTIALSACNSGGVAQPTNHNVVSTGSKFSDASLKSDLTPQVALYTLGTPWNSKIGAPIPQTDVQIDIKPNDTVTVSSKSSEINFGATTNQEDFRQKLGISGSIKGKYKEANGEITVDYLNQKNKSNTSIDYYLSYKTSATVKFDNKKYAVPFSGAAPDMTLYGDTYVSSAKMGIAATAIVSLNADTLDTKDALTASLKGSYGDLGSLVASLNKEESSLAGKLSITVKVLQFGGNSENIYKIGNFDTSKGYGVLECSVNNIKPCTQVISALADYATQGDDSLKEQANKYLSVGANKPYSTVVPNLFVFDAGGGTAVTGYYNVDDATQQSVKEPINPQLSIAISGAETKFTNGNKAIAKLEKILELSRNSWQYKKVSTALNNLTPEVDSLQTVTQQCFEPSVLSDNELISDCTTNINNQATTVKSLTDEVEGIVDGFKGFLLIDHVGGKVPGGEYLLPTSDNLKGGVVSFRNISSDGLALAQYLPNSTITLNTTDKSLTLGMIPQYSLQNYADTQWKLLTGGTGHLEFVGDEVVGFSLDSAKFQKKEAGEEVQTLPISKALLPLVNIPVNI